MVYWNLKNCKIKEIAPPVSDNRKYIIVTTAAIGINKSKPKDAAKTF